MAMLARRSSIVAAVGAILSKALVISRTRNQAPFLGYMDAFWVLMLISLAAVPLALALRRGTLGGAVPMGH